MKQNFGIDCFKEKWVLSTKSALLLLQKKAHFFNFLGKSGGGGLYKIVSAMC